MFLVDSKLVERLQAVVVVSKGFYGQKIVIFFGRLGSTLKRATP